MFGLFKKNKNKGDHNDGHIAPPAVVSPATPPAGVSHTIASKPEISLDALIDIVNKKWVANAHSSLFYAQCGGFPHEVLGYDPERHMEYFRLVRDANLQDFKVEDKVKALNFFSKGAPREFRKFYKKFEPEEVAEALLELAISKRESDQQQFIAKVDERFEYLGPIFQRLSNSDIDKYGEYDPGPALEEVEEFVNYYFTDDDFNFYYSIKPIVFLLNYIEEKLEREASTQSGSIPLDGIEFEHWTASELSRQGWQVQVSQASGDQGVDVMAKRDGCSVAVQCKRYSKPIGNKAVQEIFAAKQFSFADHACVIGTGGFTRSARELAGATEVLLIEAEAGLQNFSSSFGFDNASDDEHSDELGDYQTDDDEIDIEELRNQLGIGFDFDSPAERFLLKSATTVLAQAIAQEGGNETALWKNLLELIEASEDQHLVLLALEWQMVLVWGMTALAGSLTEDTVQEIVSGRGDYDDETRNAVRNFEGTPPTYLGLSSDQRSGFMGKVFEIIEGAEIDEDDVLEGYSEIVLFMVKSDV